MLSLFLIFVYNTYFTTSFTLISPYKPCHRCKSTKNNPIPRLFNKKSSKNLFSSPPRALKTPLLSLTSPSRKLKTPSLSLTSPSRKLEIPSLSLTSPSRKLETPISGSNHSLSPAMMEMAEKRISLSVVKDALRVLNQKYLDIENRNQQSIQSSGMSLGESLFRQFTEPYFNFAV